MIQSLIRTIRDKITTQQFINKSKKSPKDFTRTRKVSFSDMTFMIFSNLGRSIQAGIDTFIVGMNKDFDTYSKQAFSKGRQRIKPKAFRELLWTTVKHFYENADCNTFKGNYVLAVDGSKIDLPYNKQLMEKYGCQKGTNNSIQALASCLVDVMNNIVIDGILAPCNGNERKLAKKHIKLLNVIKDKNIIVLFDRGYPSAELIEELENAGIKYVMRCNPTFIAGFKKELNGADCEISHQFKNGTKKINLRTVQFPVSDETTEILVTNILDKNYVINDFKELYHMRWGIEKTYNSVKNMFCLEAFSGTLPDAVLQDFYAVLGLYNIASVIIFENNQKIKNKFINHKWQYKTNVKMAVIKVKDLFIKILMTDSKRKQNKLLKTIFNQLEREIVPIRDNRFNERKIKHTMHKFPQNQKL